MEELISGINGSPGFPALTDVRRCVRDKLRCGVFRLAPEKRGRSAVWQHFRMVLDPMDKQVGYAGCIYCLDVLKHDPHATGTSSLFSHLRICPVANKQHDVPVACEVHVKEEAVEEEPQDLLELETVKVCSEFVIQDLFPYHTLAGNGFKRLAQFLLDFGATNGRVSIENLLPEPRRLSLYIRERANSARATVKTAVDQSRCVAVTANKIGRGLDSFYVATSVHHTMNSRTQKTFIGITKIRRGSALTYANSVRESLSKFKFKESSMKFVLVTNDSNVISDLPGEHTSIFCFDHMIREVILHLFKSSALGRELNELLQTKNAGKVWRCVSDIINSASNNYDKSPDHFRYEKETTVDDLSKTKSVEDLLRPFLNALEDINSNGPTLHKVVPWLTHLRETCTAKPGDEPFLSNLKKEALTCIEDNVQIHLHHKVAVFFNPRMNSLRILNPEDKTLVLQEIKDLIRKTSSARASQSRKRPRSDDPLAYLEDEEQDEDRAREREIQLYTLMRDHSNSDDLLDWWQRNSSHLPTLADLALSFLGIPASSKPSPEIGKIVAKIDRQEWDDVGSLDDLAFLHSQLPEEEMLVTAMRKSSGC